MALPEPRPGLVIRYSYLWRHQRRRGRSEGAKDRPCVVVVAIRKAAGMRLVTVAPITRSPPDDATRALALAPKVRRHLGLDADRSWIVADEVNQFVWPGPDLRPLPARAGSFAYGYLPEDVFEALRSAMIAIHRAGKLRAVRRSE